MVDFWADELDNAIKRTKRRIAHAEKHGIGYSAMQEKAILKIQEKNKLRRAEK